jgi:hypothetical protein
MKKMFFLMLALLIWSVASMNAQVTIGSANPPHSGAILDLQSTTQGLKLPNVALDDDLTVFGLPDTDPAADAKGMYVYNTNPNIGEGVYVWDGDKWLQIKESENLGEGIVITRVRIKSTDDKVFVFSGLNLQLSVVIESEPELEPESDVHVTWAILPGTGYASINENGLLVGRVPGSVYVTASVGGKTATQRFNVITNEVTPTLELIGSNEYLTLDFGGDVWMVENSREGTAQATSYADDGERIHSYYNKAHANFYHSCPGGNWHVPTLAEANHLLQTLAQSTDNSIQYWIGYDNMLGWWNSSNGWEYWGDFSRYWIQEPNTALQLDRDGYVRTLQTVSQANYHPVRCVKNK